MQVVFWTRNVLTSMLVGATEIVRNSGRMTQMLSIDRAFREFCFTIKRTNRYLASEYLLLYQHYASDQLSSRIYYSEGFTHVFLRHGTHRLAELGTIGVPQSAQSTRCTAGAGTNSIPSCFGYCETWKVNWQSYGWLFKDRRSVRQILLVKTLS